MTIYLFREPAGIDTGWRECSRDAYEAHKGQAAFEVMVVDETHHERDLMERAASLLKALDDTFWSSWQSTSKFSQAMESLRELIQGTQS